MGPAGAAALAVGALAVAIGVFVTKADEAAHAGERWAASTKSTSDKAETLLRDWQELNGEKALDEQTSTRLLALYPGLAEKMDVNAASAKDLLAAIKELNKENAAKAAQEWIDKLQKQQVELVKSEEALRKYTEGAKKNIAISLSMGDLLKAKEFEEAIEVYAYAVDDMRKKIANSVTQANAILATVGQKLGNDNVIIDIPVKISDVDKAEAEAKTATERVVTAAGEAAVTATDETAKKLSQRLSEISFTPEQQFNEQINQVKTYLNQRANLENKSGEERIKALIEERDRVLSILTSTEEERRAINEATDLAIAEYHKQIDDEETLTERLNKTLLTEQQTQNEQIQQFQQFLQQRMELELANQEEQIQNLTDTKKTMSDIVLADNEDYLLEFGNRQKTQSEIEIEYGKNRIAWLEEQKKQMSEMDNLNAEEKIALTKSVNKMILEEDTKLKEAQEKLMHEKLKASQTFFGGIEDLASLASDKSIGLLIVEKAAASAQALINSYLAFTNALGSVPYPFNLAAAAGVLASGIATQVKILSTPIPSAETGGRFIVPNSVGSDSSLMKVNAGEEIDVTPRGQVGFSKQQRITVQIEKQTIFDVINDGIRSGDVLIVAVNY